jgi:hypothetical protein
MTIDLADKRIIMIHGRASKPAAEVNHELWRHTLVENIRVSHRSLARSLDLHPEVFVSAYWADVVPHHIPDDAAYCRKLRIQVDRVIAERRTIRDHFHVGMGERVGSFFQDRGVDLAKLLIGALDIKDEVMTYFLRETELYDRDQYIADRMRAPLEAALRDAWNSGMKPVVIAHSMGSFIAYDVLWRFSHRRASGFAAYNRKRVKIFVSLGSPLGDASVRNLLFARHHRQHGRRQYPTNIDSWHNYACLGDVVAHQKNFHDIFYQPMRALQLFPADRKFRTIDYVNLHNPFEVVSHAGNRGREKRNPHKSYGYLAQPRLGSWLADYLLDRLL